MKDHVLRKYLGVREYLGHPQELNCDVKNSLIHNIQRDYSSHSDMIHAISERLNKYEQKQFILDLQLSRIETELKMLMEYFNLEIQTSKTCLGKKK